MTRLIMHLTQWLIALAVLAIILIVLGFYLYPGVQPLRDKPLVAITLRDLSGLVFFGFVVVGGPLMYFRAIGQMIETAREDFDDWRRLRRRITCPRCGELAWNEDSGAHCPYCGWDTKFESEVPELFRD